LIANVCRIGVVVTEEAGDGSQRADAAFADQALCLEPLRVRSHHERFLYADAVAIASVD